MAHATWAEVPALDPSKSLRQYVHDVWTTEDGLPSIEVQQVLQTRDGYLWLATRNGLVRFDGLRFEVFNLENTPTFETDLFSSLAEGPDGSLWMGSYGGGVYRLRDGRFEVFLAEAPAHNDVRALFFDRSGGLWVGTLDGVLRMVDGQLRPETDPQLVGATVSAFFEEEDGTIWIAVIGRGVVRYREGRYATVVQADGSAQGLSSDDIQSLHRDADGTLWVATTEGLNRIRDGQVTVFGKEDGLTDGGIVTLVRDAAGTLWIGGSRGLNRLRGERFDSLSLSSLQEPGKPLRYFLAKSFLVDREGSLWVGTYGQGLHRFRDGAVTPYTTAEGLVDNLSMAVFEDRAGDILIAGSNGGLNRLRGGVLETLWPPAQGPFEFVWSVIEDRQGRFWVGSREGLFRYHRGSFRSWGLAEGLPYLFVRVVYEDPVLEDTFWIGTTGGGVVCLRNGELEPLDTVDSLSDNRVRSLFKDRSGALWVGTEVGLNRLQDGKIETFTTEDGLGSNAIRPLYEDPEGVLWIGTSGGGLTRYRDGVFTAYTKRDGLPQNDVWALVEDHQENLWWSTDQGILRLAKEAFDAYDQGQLPTLPVRTFDVSDGMKHVEGNGHGYPAGLRSSDGNVWLISTVGVNRIDPAQRTTSTPSVVVEALLAGEEVQDTGTALHLPYERRDLEIRYSALSFNNSEKIRFKVRLDGYQDTWQDVGTRRVAYYTNVPAGQYTFRVKAANVDGLWSEEEASVELTVLPPLWRTKGAFALYLLLLASFLMAAVKVHQLRLGRERALRRREAERDRQIIQRLQEVDRLKDDFLANTSHELQTPLHGMIGLAESLIVGARGSLSKEVVADLSILASSGRRLSHLVRDMLDFSKLRHKSLELQRRPVDLRATAEVVLTLSRRLVGGKDVELVNSVPAELPAAYADENRLQQILYNLVSNATKFTEMGWVDVSAELVDGELMVRISDTGIGISREQQERVFEAFEQVDSKVERKHGGTGIGLALTSQLVQLHGGSLGVDSLLGEGAVFHFTLPVAASQGAEEEAQKVSSENPMLEVPVFEGVPTVGASGGQDTPPSAGQDVRARILVVDDEEINLLVISNFLAHEGYELITASSGEEALAYFKKGTFDLILLDVMMPKISGYEVCRTMRETHSIERLPILFLSAMRQSRDRVAGLEEGANDFLTKPVSQSELLTRVRIHLELLAAHRSQEAEIEGLQGLLPICAHCKRIRDDKGRWNALERYIEEHAGAQLSHGICPDCITEVYPSFSSPQ